jgi:diguanylate cyclase (GGDEF)-like protein/PAS domain S-box-containing protein
MTIKKSKNISAKKIVAKPVKGKESASVALSTSKMTKAQMQSALTEMETQVNKLQRSSDNQKVKLKDLRSEIEAFRSAGQAFIYTDNKGIIIDVNDSFLKMFECDRKKIIGTSAIKIAHKNNDENLGDKIKDTLDSKYIWEGEVVVKRYKSKKPFPIWIRIFAIKGRGAKAKNYSATLLDITDFKQTEKMLVQKAHFDMLTKLPNRTLMLDRFTQAINLAKRYHYSIGVMLIDLDRFKEINDSLGHHVGDLLLVETANRLLSTVRDSDTVARLGGDEFLLILPEIGKPDNAAILAKKIIELLASPFNLADHEIFISGSVGIAMFPHDGEDPDQLAKNADTAMYHAKAQGKNNFKFFTEDINKSTVERFMLENRFRQAIDKLEFHLNYQPKIDIKTGKIAGMEALLRWYHPDQGSVQPALFIPLAEETGLVVPLGEWALREACRQNKAWQDEGLRPLRISVNLSPKQFMKRDIVTLVEEVLKETELEPKYLMLEITESCVVEHIEDTILVLNSFRKMGVGVSIDDFGTGYSSLNYLNRFALDELKIDRSFISNLGDHDNRKVINAIIALGHELNHKVVAEGVETAEQLEFLCGSSCNEVQGFYFSRPLTAERFHALITDDPTFMQDRLKC